MSSTDLTEILGILTRLDIRASSVWVSHLAAKEKILQLASTPWHDPELNRYTNKTRMKEVGGAAMNYMGFITESLFAGLAKSIEDFWIDLRLTARVKYDIWKSHHQPMFLHDAKVVRSIGNIIKHNQSIIESKSSDHAKFLVNDAGFPNSAELKTLFISEHPLLKTSNMTYLIYLYCLDLLRLTCGFVHPVLGLAEPERRQHVAENLVPPVLQLNAI